MKKYLIFYLIILCATLSAQKNDSPYEFPVKPGTVEWKLLTSSDQMDRVCVIPDQTLKDMSAHALFITCLNYPRLIDVFMASNLQAGFDFYSKHFNGLAELIGRSDLAQVLLQSYINLEIQNGQIKGTIANMNDFQVAFIELLIAQEFVINQLSSTEKELLLEVAQKNLLLRKAMRSSLYRQKTSALIISRILYSIDKNISELDRFGNDIFLVFNSYAVLSDSTVVDKLYEASKVQ